MSNPISSVNSSSAFSAADRVPVQKLEQDDFIKLLVAQLTSQDPLNPQKDTEFVAQMAQFSALESTKAMQAEIQSLRAHQLLGQTVEIRLSDAASVVGTVEAVDSAKGQPQIIVGGKAYSLKDVFRVENSTNNTAAA